MQTDGKGLQREVCYKPHEQLDLGYLEASPKDFNGIYSK